MTHVTSIAWRETCPWVVLFRTFRLAISLPVLFLATVGALLTPLGWYLSGTLFVRETDDPYFASVVERNGQWPDVVGEPERLVSSPLDAEYTAGRLDALANVPAVFLRIVRPFQRAASHDLSLSQGAYYLFGGVWNVVVWSFLAGAITRIAAVQLGREERFGLREALSHAGKNFGWYLVAPFFPMLGIVLTVLPMALLGLLMRTAVGAALGGLLWILVLIGGLIIAILLLGLLFGWPLMWPTISSEESCDAFEAFSRSYSYTFQRPLHYLFYTVVVVLFGGVSWLLVSVFADTIVHLANWSVTWGSGTDRMADLLEGQPHGLGWAGTAMITFFNGLVYSIASGFNYAFFFCSAVAIYLLLRRLVDQIEMDEVFIEEESPRYNIPGWQPK
jgi:hypothetical protein